MSWKVKDWGAEFENNRTRELKHLEWVPIPNRMDGDGYTELVDHPNGAAHFGAWIAIVEIASKCDERGTLMRNGRGIPHDAASLSRISRIPEEIFLEAIPRLIKIGWLEPINVIEITRKPEKPAEIPQEGATPPQEGASTRARDEGNGREWNRREENGKEAPRVFSSRREFDSDETFTPFAALCRQFWPDIIDEDLQAGWQFTWKKFDPDNKLLAINNLERRIENREDYRYVKRPPKYLETGEWKRRPRDPTKSPASTKQSERDAAWAEVMRD